MTDTNVEIITNAINDMRAQKINDVLIATYFLGASVPVMIEASGTATTAKFLRDMADQVELHADKFTVMN